MTYVLYIVAEAVLVFHLEILNLQVMEDVFY